MAELRRREFLKRSILGTTGALIAVPTVHRTADAKIEGSGELITRTLGKTGITLPVVSMGVMRADNPALVRGALKAGMVHLDTAHGYQKGRNEEMLGEVLKDFPRSSFVIATKIPPEASREAFLEKLDISLGRLKLAAVDILYLHNIASRGSALDPVMLESLAEARKVGKARFVGLSTHKNEPEVIDAAVESGVYDVVLSSVNFMQDHFTAVKRSIERASGAGIGVIAMKTMAGGFFDKGRTQPINCKAALKWVLQDTNITTAIPGIVNFDQLAQNASVATDLTLTDQEKADLGAGPQQGGLYCNGCEHCVATCARRLPIPEFMRAYMYTYGYGSAALGRETINGLNPRNHFCVDCARCTAECVKGFDIKGKIADIGRLADVPEEFLA